MQYVSTRGQTPPMSFQDAVVTGLAPDGGLLLPAEIPDVRDRLDAWRDLGFVDLAVELLPLFVDDIDRDDLETLIRDAYATFDADDVVPLVAVGDVEVLELFHGPTLAFKDVALQLLGRLFDYVLSRRGEHLNILAATSGDTGSAAIAGVRGLDAVDIFVMYPDGRVSALQELQMTTVTDANVHCLAVDGSFDDCQTLMKTLFADLDFKGRFHLGAVNSVNWARVLAQIVYYAYASLKRGGEAPVTFCVPTGNFGNVFAGYLAKRMGFPIARLVLATNENDILSKFFATGEYQRGEVRFTVTPAMDIQVASNFERYLYYLMNGDSARLRAFMQDFATTGRAVLDAAPGTDDFFATAVDVEDTLATIRRLYDAYGYVADPHTAVGIAAAERFPTDGPVICLATAHPAKFPESVDKAVGSAVARHPRLEGLRGLESRRTEIPATLDAVKDFIAAHARVR
ncbi:MAG: threonine synthase [Gammaproteobacteria bacterium]|nr:threonine synthase [Gammaproteobacteria bacterium]MBK82154.1 threonine synthase [Gammaproteobacteria bacterium]